jgi:hypothetical protein
LRVLAENLEYQEVGCNILAEAFVSQNRESVTLIEIEQILEPSYLALPSMHLREVVRVVLALAALAS